MSRFILVVWFAVWTGASFAALPADIFAAVAEDDERIPLSLRDKTAGPVQWTRHEEHGNWVEWNDDRLALRLPASWSIHLDKSQEEPRERRYIVRRGAQRDAPVAFEVHVVEGGSEFIGCFCAPRWEYQYSTRGPYKIWSLFQTVPETDTAIRTFKVANKELRLDIHATLPKDGDATTSHAIESARPKR